MQYTIDCVIPWHILRFLLTYMVKWSKSGIIKMHILLTALPTFLVELVRRHLIPGEHFLYSHHLNVGTSSDNVKRNFIFVSVGA